MSGRVAGKAALITGAPHLVHPTGVNTPMGSGNMQAEIGAAIAGVTEF